MRKYELIIIFSPLIGDAELKDEIEKYKGQIESFGATVTEIESWGRRELAFFMKKQKHGTYVCFKFESESGEAAQKLPPVLRIADSILFSEVHRVSDKVRKVKRPMRRGDSGLDESLGADADF